MIIIITINNYYCYCYCCYYCCCCRLEFLLLGLLVLRPSISSLLQVYYDSLFYNKVRQLSYYKVRQFYYKVRWVLQSATIIKKCDMYLFIQAFFPQQLGKRLINIQFTSLPKSPTGHVIQTYLKIRCVSRDPAGSDIVVYHTSTARIFCKTHCTPAGCFTGHVEEQLVVAIGPMQHEIAVTSTKHSVIQYINYMEKKENKISIKIRSS